MAGGAVGSGRTSISNINKVIIKDTGMYGVPNRLQNQLSADAMRPQSASSATLYTA